GCSLPRCASLLSWGENQIAPLVPLKEFARLFRPARDVTPAGNLAHRAILVGAKSLPPRQRLPPPVAQPGRRVVPRRFASSRSEMARVWSRRRLVCPTCNLRAPPCDESPRWSWCPTRTLSADHEVKRKHWPKQILLLVLRASRSFRHPLPTAQVKNPRAVRTQVHYRGQQAAASPAGKWTCAARSQDYFNAYCKKTERCRRPTVAYEITHGGGLRVPVSRDSTTENQRNCQHESTEPNAGTEIAFLGDGG